jgi:hypothetical protein
MIMQQMLRPYGQYACSFALSTDLRHGGVGEISVYAEHSFHGLSGGGFAQ